jgi:hypothetical protein
MTPPFIPAALAPTALAGLLALTIVPGTSQAAPAAASSATATVSAHRLVLPAAPAAYSTTARAQQGDTPGRADRSHVRSAGDHGSSHRSRTGDTGSPQEKRDK